MSGFQIFMTLVIGALVALSVVWLGFGTYLKLSFVKVTNTDEKSPAEYKILVDGYGRYTVTYHVSDGFYMTLTRDLPSMSEAEDYIANDREWRIKRVNKLVKEIE